MFKGPSPALAKGPDSCIIKSTLKKLLFRQDILEDFEAIFYPRSIAVVGASANPAKRAGASFFYALYKSRYKGKLYAVSSSGGELLGQKIYQSLSSIPEKVDYVIAAVPRNAVLELIDECIAKGAKVIQFFTAGFSELDPEKGKTLEEEMLKRARRGGLRLIGPNCVGVYSPEISMTINTEGQLGEPGEIAFICQSGSLTEKLLEAGVVRGIRFSKGVSYGNGIDLDCPDFLKYFGADSKTRVIGIYIEGTRDGKAFFNLCNHISSTKPILLLKGGRRESSRRTALSHTGSMGSSEEIWSAFCRQTGVIMVESFQEMVDTFMGFQQLGSFDGRGIAPVTGFIDGGGGEAVLAQDALMGQGLDVIPFSGDTQARLEKVLNPVGSILHNPLDVSQSYSQVHIIREALLIAARDPQIKLLFPVEHFELMCRYWGQEYVTSINDILIDIKRNLGKEIALVMIPGLMETERQKEEKRLLKEKIAVFHSMEGAMKALRNMKAFADLKALAQS